jgi:hypothetical protein
MSVSPATKISFGKLTTGAERSSPQPFIVKWRDALNALGLRGRDIALISGASAIAIPTRREHESCTRR